jgi:hypothetical protein
MDDSDVLGALGRLSQPVSKLVEAVAAGIGKAYEPTHLVRMAKAAAHARLIAAQTEFLAEPRSPHPPLKGSAWRRRISRVRAWSPVRWRAAARRLLDRAGCRQAQVTSDAPLGV